MNKQNRKKLSSSKAEDSLQPDYEWDLTTSWLWELQAGKVETSLRSKAESHHQPYFLKNFFFLIPTQGYVYWFESSEREEREEREKHWYENIDWLLPICTPTRDPTCNPGMCPDPESDPQPLVYRTMLQSTEPPSQSPALFLINHIQACDKWD